MSTRQYLINAASKHQVFIQRNAGSMFKQMLPFLKEARNETLRIINNAPTVFSKARMTLMLKEIENVNRLAIKSMAIGTKKQALELARYEAGFTERLTAQAIAIPSKESATFNFTAPTAYQIQTAAFSSIMDATPGYGGSGGLTVGKALESFGKDKAAEITKHVRIGYALGETNEQIAKKISITMETTNLRQANTLARTITNHVASIGRAEFYKNNADILTSYQVVATLDDRTTLTCGALDGKVFSEAEFVEPPYHWNCRTTFIAIVNPQYDASSSRTGERPSKGEDGEIEKVATNTTYNSWLKTQSSDFQNEVLGKERGELFRAGMNVDKFVDHQYQPINLDELRNKDNEHIFAKIDNKK